MASDASNGIEALRVDKAHYISPDIHLREKARLWPSVWLMACREEQVEKNGQFVVFDIADESILVLRAHDGALRAFFNVCQHRGRRLKDEEAGTLGRQIACPFHAWRYDLEGNPTYIPHRADWDVCAEFREEALALKAVKIDTWGGWVWISMNPDIEPLAEYLAPIPELYEKFEFENCRIEWFVTLRLPCNWKVMMDAFNESYHVEGTHPQLLKYTPGGKAPTVPEGRHGSLRVDRNTSSQAKKRTNDAPAQQPVDLREMIFSSTKEINESIHALNGRHTLRAAERLMAEVPADASPMDVMTSFKQFHREAMEGVGARWPVDLTDEAVARAGGTWHVFPNTIILAAVDGSLTYRARPDGDNVDSCLFDIWWHARFGPGDPQPSWKHEFYDRPEDFRGRNRILEEDFANIRAVQRGMKSQGFSHATTNPYQESTITNFHRVLDDYLNE